VICQVDNAAFNSYLPDKVVFNRADLDDAKAQFRAAWARIRASLTDQDIADPQRIAKNSAETLARYDRRRGP
jgi:hypothetical protein